MRIYDNNSRGISHTLNSVSSKQNKAPVDITFMDNRVGQMSTLQRVDTSGFVRTKNGQYMIDDNSQELLYSKKNAIAPKPTGLYHMYIDKDIKTQEQIKVWSPNVQFITKQEEAFIDTSSCTDSGVFCFNGDCLDINQKSSSLEFANKKKEILPATIGLFGKNDCNIFASKLQSLISHDEMVSTGRWSADESVRKLNNISNASEEDLKVGVGDKMLHHYPQSEKCLYHAATVVAKDENSTVTLEAHVSKDLSTPQFHIRDGVKGFIKDNNTTNRNLGENIDITPLKSIKDPEKEKKDLSERYKMMFECNNFSAPIFITGDIGSVETVSSLLIELALEIAKEFANIYNWDNEGITKFADSDEGLLKARIRLNNMKQPIPSYIC